MAIKKTTQYLYFSRRTGLLFYLKKSLDFDFSFDEAEFFTLKRDEKERFNPESECYQHNPTSGLIEVCISPRATELEELSVLREKVRILILLKTNILLLKNNIQNYFDSVARISIKLDSVKSATLKDFLIDEQGYLVDLCDQTMNKFRKEILETRSKAQAIATYQRITSTTIMGRFANYVSPDIESKSGAGA